MPRSRRHSRRYQRQEVTAMPTRLPHSDRQRCPSSHPAPSPAPSHHENIHQITRFSRPPLQAATVAQPQSRVIADAIVRTVLAGVAAWHVAE